MNFLAQLNVQSNLQQELLELLTEDNLGKDYNKVEVEMFAAYCLRTKNQKKRDGTLQNPWMQKKTSTELEKLYRRVLKDGLPFDGVHITLQSTGVSYDYVAYKNKMLKVYPESSIDIGLVYEGDTFRFQKESGKVTYTHELTNPFQQQDANVIGGYCVIKNKRGEFLTILSKEEIQKHRNVAKTDYIWKAWFKEMVMKTLIKKAVKYHFQDVFESIDDLDNENYDLDKVSTNPLSEMKQKVVQLLDVYQDTLNQKEIDMLIFYVDMPTLSWWQKRVGLLKYKCVKQNFIHNISLFLRV